MCNLLKDTIVTDTHVYFLRGFLSQWFESLFTVHGEDYNCCEQFMMASKAALFKDWETFFRIKFAKSPSEQKALGREVKNYNQQLWDDNKLNIVTLGNKFKFSQNEDLLDEFERIGRGDNGLRTFVECNPKDKVWGIGLGLDNPDIYDENKWQGENLLGLALNNVYIDLFGE